MNDELEMMLEAAGTAPLAGGPAQAAARFADRAGAEGLVDVAYATVDSPLGPLLTATTRRGLVRLAYDHNDFDVVLDRLATRISPRVLEAPGRLDEVRRELEDYFAGQRRHFELAIDWALVGRFGRRVLEATAGIAYGDVCTYKEVADRAGNPRASRATGNALGANPIPIVVPCHRVLRTGGGLGGYTGGLDNKRALLAIEGVKV